MIYTYLQDPIINILINVSLHNLIHMITMYIACRDGASEVVGIKIKKTLLSCIKFVILRLLICCGRKWWDPNCGQRILIKILSVSLSFCYSVIAYMVWQEMVHLRFSKKLR